nr:hypothetical protein [Tanacetum cinerariifolium]
ELKAMYSKQDEQELLQTVREFHTSNQEEGQSVSSHVLKMKGYIENLKDSVNQLNYNMHGMGKTVNELHAMHKLHEETLPKKDDNPTLHAIRAGRVQKNHKNKSHKAGKGSHGKGKGKMGNTSNNASFSSKPKTPPPPKKDNSAKDAICHQYGEVGHWRRNCPVYLGLRGSKKLKPGALSLYVGDGHHTTVEAIRIYHLELPSGLVIVLNNFHYAPSITRGVISVSLLFDDGFINRFDDNNVISVSKNNLVYFKAVPRDGIYEIDMSCSNANDSSMYFKKEVENQLGKTIKSLRSNRGGNPKETMGYSFYNPSENKVFVARNAEFFESKLLDLKASGSVEDLELIQKEDTNPSVDTSLNHKRMIKKLMNLKEHELGDLDEPANCKAALLDPKSKKWIDAMNVEMQSMKDNELKQASRQWNKRFDDEIKKFGFTQNPDEPCVYIKSSGSYIAILILYVDDILLMGNNIPMLQDVKSHLGRSFALKDLGEAAYILGIKIYRDRLKRLIGSVMYAVRCTHPDVAFVQNMTSRFQQNSGEEHWTVVKNILKYLRNTKDMFLVYGGNMERELRVSCYTDAGYLTDADNLKSQTRYVFILNGGVVDWKNTKQSIFATSSTDAEYIAAFDASKEAVWICKFISGLGIVSIIKEPISMYCDNTGAMAIAKDDGVTKGARHFRAKVHYLRETIKLGDVKIEKIHTDDNLADPFTKALAFPKHSELTRNI